MRKGIVFVLSMVIIFLMIAGLSLLLPAKMSLTKSIGISAPAEEVYKKLEDFKSWPAWFPPMEDSSLKIVYSTSPATAIISDNSGKELTLKRLATTGDTINIALSSKSASGVTYQFILIKQSVSNTQVIFNINTTFKWYPWEKIKGVFSDKIAGPVYQKAVIQLKRSVETN